MFNYINRNRECMSFGGQSINCKPVYRDLPKPAADTTRSTAA
jgi:hypothetical protein